MPRVPAPRPRLNAVDRLVSYFNPVAGERRLHSRLKLALAGAYEGAGRGRRHDGWSPKPGSANADLFYDLARLRDRARDLVRNTPHAANAVRVLSGRMIGTGITPRFKGAGRQQASDAWRWFADAADYDGDTDFYGLQALLARTVAESGEALVLKRPAASSANLKVPLQLQVLEPDYLDDLKNADLLPSGGRIVQGVELDAQGRRVAYWIFDRHPGDLGRRAASRRVPVSALWHLYRKDRPGQLRAAPWFAPVMLKMRHLDDYDEAELYAKKLQASYVAFIKLLGGNGLPAGSTTDAESGLIEEETRIGMNYYLKPDEDVVLSAPPPSQGYADFATKQLHDLAAGLGITYEMLSGDLRQVNYSSYKAGEILFRAHNEQLRWHLWVPRLCQPVWDEVARTAQAVGLVDGLPERVHWTPPRYESVEPLTDYKATVLAVRSGLMSLQEAVQEQGFDAEAVLDEIAEMNRLLDAKRIILDSDPRRSTPTGGPRPADNPGEDDGDTSDERTHDTDDDTDDDAA